MGASTRVLNLTNGCRLKRSQARGRVEQCLSVWVSEGFSIRDLSLSERIQARSEQARLESPMPLSEIPGLIYKPTNLAAHRESQKLAQQANQFFVESLP